MNFSIRCRLIKLEHEWKLEIPILDYDIRASRPLLCLGEFERKLKTDLNNEQLRCFFRIDDSGIIYLVTAQTPELIQYIADKMLDLNAVKLEPNLDYED